MIYKADISTLNDVRAADNHSDGGFLPFIGRDVIKYREMWNVAPGLVRTEARYGQAVL